MFDYRKVTLPITVLLLFCAVAALGAGSAKVTEEPLVIPTYQIGSPEENPSLAGRRAASYPYSLLDRLTDNKVDKTYNAVWLENEFIKVLVLPELGGRLHAATDKTNNYDFMYNQHVIKPGLVGMLGAWISGGIEWNFPHGHRPSGFMPINHTVMENPDGSVSAVVGEIEPIYRMHWVVKLTVFPGKSYIQGDLRFINRTPLTQSFQFWATAAFHANDNFKMIYDTNVMTGHGKHNFYHWPIHEGVDVRWWKNLPTANSYFDYEGKSDFFGGYDHGKDAGTVIFADHHTVPGKKFWTWGASPSGRLWDIILTDSDGPYVEPQSGGFSDNQPDCHWMEPYEVKSIRIYWYPVRGMKDYTWANLKGAVNLTVEDNKIDVGAITTQDYKGARVVVTGKDKSLLDKTLDIGPGKPFQQTLSLPAGCVKTDLDIKVLCPKGDELVGYRPETKPDIELPEPKHWPTPIDECSDDELVVNGLKLVKFSRSGESIPYFEEALKRDPGNLRANTALATIYLKQFDYKGAEKLLLRALERDPSDGQARYNLGRALKGMGDQDEAYKAFFKAIYRQAWYPAGYLSLAEIDVARGDYALARDHINLSIETNADCAPAFCLQSVILRHLDRNDEAAESAEEALALDPLSFWGAYELHLALKAQDKSGEAQEALAKARRLMRGDPQAYLAVATDYAASGSLEEAVAVLDLGIAAAGDPAKVYPMLHYYKGFYLCRSGKCDLAHERFALGAKMSPDRCFPHRAEALPVLEEAIKHNPKDGRAHYYLGNLLYAKGAYVKANRERAIALWEKAAAVEPNFSVLQRNLGLAYWAVLKDKDKAEKAYLTAIKNKPADPKLYLELDDIYLATGADQAARLKFTSGNKVAINDHDDLYTRVIQLQVANGKYADAVKMLDGHNFHSWEGRYGIHDVYVDAHLGQGNALMKRKRYDQALKHFKATLEYPVALQVGRPHHPALARRHYYIATAYQKMGYGSEAEEYFRLAANEKYKQPTANSCYVAMARKELGDPEVADRMIDQVIEWAEGNLEKGNGLAAVNHYALGLAYQAKGDKRKAQEEIDRAVSMNPDAGRMAFQMSKRFLVTPDSWVEGE